MKSLLAIAAILIITPPLHAEPELKGTAVDMAKAPTAFGELVFVGRVTVEYSVEPR